MISKGKIKYIRSLEMKKFRDQSKTFVAEGSKVVGELLHHFEAELIIHTENYHSSAEDGEDIVVSAEELRRISFLRHPQDVLAVFKQRDEPSMDSQTIKKLSSRLSLLLDNVQDPGNVGTIVRIADWYGIENVFCSPHCADIYNPKVIQATMGSLSRVTVSYIDLETLLSKMPSDFPVYGALLDGDNIYKETLGNKGFVIMGNEGNGISENLRKKVNKRILIPCYPPEKQTIDSLNVAIATAVICNEFRRKSS